MMGNFKKLHDLSNVLVNKSNWLCEYLVLKNVVMRRANLFDIKPYILNNVTKSLRFAFYNGFHCIIDKKCKFVYETFLSKMFEKPCYQSYLSREFCISKPSWRNIYE